MLRFSFSRECRGWRRVAVLAFLVAAACSDAGPTGPGQTSGGVDSGNHPAFPGFDTSIYPGDVALAAWRWPYSPYRWVGYYLGGPCHRDETWRGRRAQLTAQGWGTAAIYVGQQDWSQIPDLLPLMSRVDVSESLDARLTTLAVATCSASLLTDAQGQTEGQDAAARMASDGFPVGSTVFLDVEYVTTVNDALVTYMKAWIRGVLTDGRYHAGVYMARFNAATFSAAARDAYASAGVTSSPTFWIAASSSSLGFSMDSRPTDVGLSYASVWQGKLDVNETWASTQVTIDANVASAMSPSAPGSAAQVVDAWGSRFVSSPTRGVAGSGVRNAWLATEQ